jgi:hypothetical protein
MKRNLVRSLEMIPVLTHNMRQVVISSPGLAGRALDTLTRHQDFGTGDTLQPPMVLTASHECTMQCPRLVYCPCSLIVMYMGRDTPLAFAPLLATIAVWVSTVMGSSSHHRVTTCSSLHACNFGDFSFVIAGKNMLRAKQGWCTLYCGELPRVAPHGIGTCRC